MELQKSLVDTSNRGTGSKVLWMQTGEIFDEI